MTKITKKTLQILAHNIMLELKDEELTILIQEFNIILKQMNLIKKINTNNISPMHFPFKLIVNYLRKDNEIIVSNKNEILEIAPKKFDDYIIINKVIE